MTASARRTLCGMEIGEPKRVIVVEPLESPVPAVTPEGDDESAMEPAVPPTEPVKIPA